MKREDVKKFILGALSGFSSLALVVILYFILLRMDDLQSFVGDAVTVLMPFVYGGVLAYLLKTPCNYFEKRIEKILPQKMKKASGALTVFLVLIFSLLILYLLLSMVIPQMISSIISITAALPKGIRQFTNWLENVTSGNEVVESYVSDTVNDIGIKLKSWSETSLLPMLENIMGGFAATVGSIVGLLKNLILGLIIAIYLLLGRKNFARQGKAVVYSLFKPKFADQILDEFRFIDRTFVGFFGGKILDSAIVGLICYIFCFVMSYLTDFPNGMLISVIVGVTNIIPYFGPFIGAIPSALLILMSSPMNCVFFLIFIVILQQIDGNILGPKLLADSVGISGFWVLFAITVFSAIFGFAGVLIGVPVFAVIYDLIRRFIIQGLKHNGKLDILSK